MRQEEPDIVVVRPVAEEAAGTDAAPAEAQETDQHVGMAAPIRDAEDEWGSSIQIDADECDSAEYYENAQRREQLANARRKSLISAGQLVHKGHNERSFLIGPDLLPKRGRMLITGTSGTGKSALTLHLAACLASRQPPFGIYNTHNDENYGRPRFPVSQASMVLYIDYELPDEIRAEKRLKPLVRQFPEVVLSNLYFPPHPSLYRLHNQVGEGDGKGSFDALQKLVATVRPDVLILDPLSSAHTLEENSIAIKQALNNVDRLIDLYGCTAIVVHHASTKSVRDRNGKPVDKPTIAEPRGHSSLVDWCDVLLHLADDSGKADHEEKEEDEESDEDRNSVKIIEMRFGKSRYCRKPDKRQLRINFHTMEVGPVPKRRR